MAANTARQQRFIREYLVDREGAAAARRAGYAPKNANRQAYDLLQDPEIQQQIAELEAELAKRAQLSADALVAETHRIAYDRTEPAAARLKALEILLEIVGKLGRRADVSLTVNVNIADVRQRIAGRLARIAAGN